MQITPVELFGAGLADSPSAKEKPEMNQDRFLQLLATEMQNQNPFSPMQNNEWMAQLAQFSGLEQMSKLNARLVELQQSEQFGQAIGLIGRAIHYQTENGPAEGIVQGVVRQAGQVSLQLDGRTILLEDIVSIEENHA